MFGCRYWRNKLFNSVRTLDTDKTRRDSLVLSCPVGLSSSSSINSTLIIIIMIYLIRQSSNELSLNNKTYSTMLKLLHITANRPVKTLPRSRLYFSPWGYQQITVYLHASAYMLSLRLVASQRTIELSNTTDFFRNSNLFKLAKNVMGTVMATHRLTVLGERWHGYGLGLGWLCRVRCYYFDPSVVSIGAVSGRPISTVIVHRVVLDDYCVLTSWRQLTVLCCLNKYTALICCILKIYTLIP